MTSFWTWLIYGVGDNPAGFRNVINKFLIFHIAIGLAASLLISADPFTFAGKALFPASSILIGLSMAWTTRASTILQSKELRAALFTKTRPPEDYVYGFQLAILVVVAMVIYVAIMAGGGINIHLAPHKFEDFASAFGMYFLLSVALRECWGVINFTNRLSILDYIRTKD
jgi:hypothetical protein